MRILIVSDIHANLVALNAVMADAGSFDRVWCLGDVVGYGPDPNGCISTLSKVGALCIAGNHDWAAMGKLDLEEFNPDARRAAIWTQKELTVNSLDWLHALPERVPTQFEKFTLVHASPRHPIWEYVLTPAVARVNFQHFDTPYCLMGHTHVPVVFRQNDDTHVAADTLPERTALNLGHKRLMVNPGSVGQPRDGDPRAAYAILNPDAMTLVHHRVEYDVAATQAQMKQAQLPQRLIARLSYGW